jgi:hypothetical protein
MAEAGALESAARIGVASDEGPPDLAERADAVVDGPEGFAEVMSLLRDPRG